MGCLSFDGRPGRHEFGALFLLGHMQRGIGEHWVSVGSANLWRLEKISLVCLAWDRHWVGDSVVSLGISFSSGGEFAPQGEGCRRE